MRRNSFAIFAAVTMLCMTAVPSMAAREKTIPYDPDFLQLLSQGWIRKAEIVEVSDGETYLRTKLTSADGKKQEEFYAEADFTVHGRIFGVQILALALRIILDKNCRRLYNIGFQDGDIVCAHAQVLRHRDINVRKRIRCARVRRHLQCSRILCGCIRTYQINKQLYGDHSFVYREQDGIGASFVKPLYSAVFPVPCDHVH